MCAPGSSEAVLAAAGWNLPSSALPAAVHALLALKGHAESVFNSGQDCMSLLSPKTQS